MSFINKAYRHDITEKTLKVMVNTDSHSEIQDWAALGIAKCKIIYLIVWWIFRKHKMLHDMRSNWWRIKAEDLLVGNTKSWSIHSRISENHVRDIFVWYFVFMINFVLRFILLFFCCLCYSNVYAFVTYLLLRFVALGYSHVFNYIFWLVYVLFVWRIGTSCCTRQSFLTCFYSLLLSYPYIPVYSITYFDLLTFYITFVVSVYFSVLNNLLL